MERNSVALIEASPTSRYDAEKSRRNDEDLELLYSNRLIAPDIPFSLGRVQVLLPCNGNLQLLLITLEVILVSLHVGTVGLILPALLAEFVAIRLDVLDQRVLKRIAKKGEGEIATMQTIKVGRDVQVILILFSEGSDSLGTIFGGLPVTQGLAKG